METADAAMPGLYLTVQPSGAKGRAFRYRHGGKPRKLTHGGYPALSLAEAREVARQTARTLAVGTDPGAAKREQRDRVDVLLRDFHRRHLPQIKFGEQAFRFLERFVLPKWGDRDVGTITKRDVLDMLNTVADSGRGVTANRVLAHARKFFNWCVERDVLDRAPTDGVKAPVRETSRDRVLTDDEVAALWKVTETMPQPLGPMVRMLLLTGQRIGEVAGMTDQEIEGDVWRLPASRTKNGRAHDVPQSPQALDALTGVRRIGTAGLIFTTNGKSPVSGFDKAVTRLRAAMPAGTPHFTFHDFRRTAVTGMARLGVPVHVGEAVVNHVSGTVSGVTAVYNRHDYAVEKRDALNKWADHIK